MNNQGEERNDSLLEYFFAITIRSGDAYFYAQGRVETPPNTTTVEQVFLALRDDVCKRAGFDPEKILLLHWTLQPNKLV